jgi:hypothetical protein
MATIEREIVMNDEQRQALEKINPEEIAREINDIDVLSILQGALLKLYEARPKERSEQARRYAVTITEMEKVVAYFKTWVIDEMRENDYNRQG